MDTQEALVRQYEGTAQSDQGAIDNAKLQLGLNVVAAGVLKVFATNYNVLRVMSGMGGLAYSN